MSTSNPRRRVEVDTPLPRPRDPHELREHLARLASFNQHVAHDIRSPMVTMTGAIQYARHALTRGEVEPAAQMLAAMSARAEGILHLLAELMALTQADAPLRREHVDLSEIARQSVDDARATAGAPAAARVCIHELPSLRGSPPLLRQVFVNLVSNGLKFSRERAEPTVDIGLATLPSGDRAVVVSDNGIGFGEDGPSRLFRPFERLHAGRYDGHGLGLCLVKRVVERHGGRVWATGEPDRGASFFLTLQGL